MPTTENNTWKSYSNFSFVIWIKCCHRPMQHDDSNKIDNRANLDEWSLESKNKTYVKLSYCKLNILLLKNK